MHNINLNSKTGKYSFFSTRQTAWHGLGQVVQDYPTSEEAMQFAGLDYQVDKIPVFAHWDNPDAGGSPQELIPVPDHFATVRTDTRQAFGVVGKDYQVVQNTEAFEFFDAIVGGGEGILYETAGALGQGERVFITAKLPGYIRVGGGDDITEKYIFLTTSHDGSGSITVAFTPIRIVCNNTLNAAMRNKTNVVRIRHTTHAAQRLKDAHKVMRLANTFGQELETLFNQWAQVRIKDEEVKKLIRMAMCPNKETWQALEKGDEDKLSTTYKNTCDQVFSYAMIAESQQMQTTKGTVFGAYNAVTGYYQNVRNFKDDSAKVRSIYLGGTAQNRGQKAFDLCNAFVQHGAAALNMN